jgi:hypothetical protein
LLEQNKVSEFHNAIDKWKIHLREGGVFVPYKSEDVDQTRGAGRVKIIISVAVIVALAASVATFICIIGPN